MRYVLEKGLEEVRTEDRVLRVMYWRRDLERYVLETGCCELPTGDRAL